MSGKAKPAGSWQAHGGRRQARANATVNSQCTQIWVGKQVVGEVRGRVFRKTVRSSNGMLRKPRGWALDVQSLHDAEAAGARLVELYDREMGLTYRAAIAKIWSDGFQFDRGYGRQIGLTLDGWQVEVPGQANQMQLFGAGQWS